MHHEKPSVEFNRSEYGSQHFANPTSGEVKIENDRIQFFLTDLYEDSVLAPGKLYLFGRIPASSGFSSVCVVVEDVPHHLYLLPAKRSEESRVPMKEVQEEVLSVLGKAGVDMKSVLMRSETKKYAFEIEGIPEEVGNRVVSKSRRRICT